MTTSIEELVAKEQHRRRGMKKRNFPYHHWLETGREEPAREHWCEYCQGFFGVPHTSLHEDEFGAWRQCRSISRAIAGNRQCACIDCFCADQLHGAGSLKSRITQA